jgi:cobalt-zinc-cadmium efflux system outer membrane protein
MRSSQGKATPYRFEEAIMRLFIFLIIAGAMTVPAGAQAALTWDEVKARFIAANPTLMAGQINIDESKALEVTAYLRPNPDFSILADQVQPIPSSGQPYRPLASAFPIISFSYLHERAHKRELRLQSAKDATAIAVSQQADQERSLIFNLRSAFVSTLQAKAQLALSTDNMNYFDKEYSVNQERFRAGDLAQMDLQRIHLQRVQYEQDYETALVTLRTAKITMVMLLNSRTPIERFDIAGRFDFDANLAPVDHFHDVALAERPDLRAALQTVAKAETDHKLAISNGSTDPTFSLDMGRANPPFTPYFGVGISIPLRLFDRNQGEKLRTEIDIRHAQRMKDATEAQVFSDVDSAYVTLLSVLNQLKPYKATYVQEASEVRDRVAYAYEHGGAALVDYLDAQHDYRTVQQAYLGLIGAYLTAAGQLNMAVGKEELK